jgi:gliding motility-associated protein GldM
MAGAKETPRQKMIGMMYLVYTALLAMNVSADILDAFAIVNDGQEKTNASIEMKLDEQYRAFEQQYAKEQEKTQIYWDKALLIREKSDEIINYIEKEVTLPLLLETEGITYDKLMSEKDPDDAIIKDFAKADPNNRRVVYEFNLKNVDSKDNYDTPTTIMINDGKATELKQKIQEYREFVVGTLEDAGARDYTKHVGLLTDTDPNGNKIVYTDADGQEISWEEKNFSHIILVAEMAILNKLVGEVQTTEFDAVSELFKRIGATDYKFNKLQARVIARSDFITQGQDYEAEVILIPSDTMSNFNARYGLGVRNFSDYKGEPTMVKSKEGVVRLKIPARNTGEQHFAGVIEMTNPETGDKEYHPFSASYIVAPPSVTISPTKMMVMYQELQNPISIAAPGVTPNDIIVNVEGGKLTKDKTAGNYFVEVDKNARKVLVKTSAKAPDGKVHDLGTQEFRVKPVPDPIVRIGDITGGKVDKEALLGYGRVMAVMKDFDFEGFNYTVDSYTVSTYRGTFIDKQNKGPRFNDEVIALISNAQSGQRIQFQDICVKSPKGEIRNIGSINVQIK